MKLSKVAMGLAFLAMSLGCTAASHADDVHHYTNRVGPNRLVHTYQGSTTQTHAVKGYLPKTTSLPVSNSMLETSDETNYSSVQAEVVGPNHLLRSPGDAMLGRDIPNGLAGQMNPITVSNPGAGFDLHRALQIQQRQPIVMTPASANYAQTLGVYDNGLTGAGVTTNNTDSNSLPSGSAVYNAASSSIFPIPTNATVGTPLPGQVPMDVSPSTGIYYNNQGGSPYYPVGYGYAYPSTSVVTGLPAGVNGSGTPTPAGTAATQTPTGLSTVVTPTGTMVTTSNAATTPAGLNAVPAFPINNNNSNVINSGSITSGSPIGSPTTNSTVESPVTPGSNLSNPFGVPNVPVRTR